MSRLPQFSPTRLKIARQLAGLKQIELAAAVGITAPALSQYEHGLHAPSPPVLQKLAFSLGLPRDFFGAPTNTPSPSPPFFRSLRSTPQRERDRAAAFAWLVARVVEAVELHVKLPKCDLRLDAEIAPPRTRSDLEAAAALVREQLGVPPGPVANVVRLLEAHGAAVATFSDGDARLSAFSQWHGYRPVVVFCLGKNDKARQRYDAAHELGHLALHGEPEPGNHVFEQQADEFASAFPNARRRHRTVPAPWAGALGRTREAQAALGSVDAGVACPRTPPRDDQRPQLRAGIPPSVAPGLAP